MKSDIAWAQAHHNEICTSKNPHVRYKDMRAISSIKEMFNGSAELYADRTAFLVKRILQGPYEPITYREAKESVNALGTALLSLGLSGKRIAVIGDNSYEWAISYLAILNGVGVVVPLDKELPATELKQLVASADVEAVIYSKKYEAMFQKMKADRDTKLSFLINMDRNSTSPDTLSLQAMMETGKSKLKRGDRSFLDAEIDTESMSVLLYTSGTTGIAKGVMLSHRNLASDLMSMVSMVHIKKEDVFFSILPIHHTYECTCGFLCPLYRGAAIAYCEGLRYITKNLKEAQPTVFLAVPLIVESLHKKIWQTAKKSGSDQKLRTILKVNRLTKKIGIDLVPLLLKPVTSVFGGRLRLFICGGASIDPAILENLDEFDMVMLQGYGLTECSPIAGLNPDFCAKADSAGAIPPLMDCKTIDTDENGNGEICIKGPNVMLGYYQNPQATAEVLDDDGWFHSGDLGYIDSDRFIHITGRKKNVIITKNGKNVFPEELEYYLGKIPYVSESLVWAKDNEDGSDLVICAALRCDEFEVHEALGDSYSKEELLTLLWKSIDAFNNDLPIYKKIRKIEIRETDFKKTTAKKIKRFSAENKE